MIKLLNWNKSDCIPLTQNFNYLIKYQTFTLKFAEGIRRWAASFLLPENTQYIFTNEVVAAMQISANNCARQILKVLCNGSFTREFDFASG
jgi:hypothetical protein